MTPGSPEAHRLGCQCDPIENFAGQGGSPVFGAPRRFLVEAACPLHGIAAWPADGASDSLYFRWQGQAWEPMARACDAFMAAGRLTVRRHNRRDAIALPFQGTFQGSHVAFFETMENGRRGLEFWYRSQLRAGAFKE